MIQRVLLILALTFSASAFSHEFESLDAQVLAAAVADFDRELDTVRADRWDLHSSPAYQRLTALRRGVRNPLSRADLLEPFKITPSPGTDGQITGSELPKNTWAITYDDGPHPTRTQAILSVLKVFSVPATFFWLAENVVKNGAVTTAVEAAGHSLQNHSYTHEDLTKVTDLALGYQVSVANQIMKDHYKEDPRFFRCPYGSGTSNRKVRTAIARENLVSVVWNVDSLDWADKNPKNVAERVRKQMLKAGRGIVLFHDIHPHTAMASQTLFSALLKSSMRYRFLTIPQIVDEMNRGRRP